MTQTTDHGRRDVLLLAICQALFMTSTAAIVAGSALIGHSLADDKSLATLPLSSQFIAMMISTIPVSLLMKRIGRKNGFTVALIVGLGGSVLAIHAILNDSFVLFCVASALVGVMNAAGQYYRFAAADAA
ncbi:MAG: MFS transporter, partial [Alphaproteobacteria bacterium]|nr:MFS transporter [Alphaproteobacteria bacterium]